MIFQKQFLLTLEEEAILLGCLLGDGHIEKRGNSYRFKIRHCVKHKEYIEYKFKKLKRFCFQQPKEISNGKKEKNYLAVYFNSKSGRFLEKYHKLFYKEKKLSTQRLKYEKSISLELINFLPKNPLLLAIWFLDDGHCRTDCQGGRIATDCFTKQEVIHLKNYLWKNYKIQTTIVNFKTNNKKKTCHYLSILGKNQNFERFINLIKPIVDNIPCMTYKIKKLNKK